MTRTPSDSVAAGAAPDEIAVPDAGASLLSRPAPSWFMCSAEAPARTTPATQSPTATRRVARRDNQSSNPICAPVFIGLLSLFRFGRADFTGPPRPAATAR